MFADEIGTALELSDRLLARGRPRKPGFVSSYLINVIISLLSHLIIILMLSMYYYLHVIVIISNHCPYVIY